MDDLVEIGTNAIEDAAQADLDLPLPERWHARAYANAILTALHSRGLAVVPVEPTEAMLNAGVDKAVEWGNLTDESEIRGIWSAMIAARPLKERA